MAESDVDGDKFLSDRGFERVNEDGKSVFYITPRPRHRKLYKRDQVEKYLTTEQQDGRQLDVSGYMFRFTKKRAKSEVYPVG